LGKNVINSQCPSSGGNGKRLNSANTRFNLIIYSKSSGTSGELSTSGIKRRLKPNNSANAMLDKGPAIATFAAPNRRSLKLRGLYGTGLAYPKINPVLIKRRSSGRITEPNKSICFMGLRLKRPRFLAVGSPKELAIKP